MKLEKIIAALMLIFAVGYNLWIYRLEPTAKIDPNDNPFQYALVHRTNEMWDFALQECPKNPVFPICFAGYLIDHWVPNWAQGFNLPYYYSHVPQIAIVATWKFLSLFSQLSLFQYYHIVIYLLLCVFPISIFFALRLIRLPWAVVGFGALAATQLSTDGLYGLDPSSFLWRGYGLSSQLFSMLFLPLAIAYAHKFLTEKTSFVPSVLFITLSIMGHLGIGVIVLMSVGFLTISFPIVAFLEKQTIYEIIAIAKEKFLRLFALAITSVGILSYWIVPAFLNNDYHNTSFWDPVWKFNSWGWREVMQLFFNGNLFDFGRFPILTLLCVVGGFAVLIGIKKDTKPHTLSSIPYPLAPFAFLFFFWMLFFFGRATWGGLIDLIPGMKDFHQSRFIVGLHLAGFFLAPIGFFYCMNYLSKLVQILIAQGRSFVATLDSDSDSLPPTNYHLPTITMIVTLISSIILFLILSPQTNAYASHNDFLIKRGNENFEKQNPDVEKLFAELKKLPPGRLYPGRGGSWGKKLQIAETTYFLHLSTFGVPVILWLPETWSPSSDVEQFFVEENPVHYNLMNVKYVVAPPDITPQPFWNLISETPSWKLYTVETEGYFTTGGLASIVETEKEYYVNLVRLWLQSDYPKQKIFPSLTFSHSEMMQTSLPGFQMTDQATYKTRDNKEYGLFGDTPRYEAPEPKVTLIGPDTTVHDMIFKTTVKVEPDCKQCLVILKQSFHPQWNAWVNGKPAKTRIVYPFYTGIEVTDPGEATIELRYQPSPIKIMLFVFGIGFAFALLTGQKFFVKLIT